MSSLTTSSPTMSSKTMLDNEKKHQLRVITLKQKNSKSHKFKELETKIQDREIDVRKQEINMAMREVIINKRQSEVIILTKQGITREAEVTKREDLLIIHTNQFTEKKKEVDGNIVKVNAYIAKLKAREARVAERETEYTILSQRLILSQTQINNLITEKMENLQIREDNIKNHELELLENYKIAQEYYNEEVLITIPVECSTGNTGSSYFNTPPNCQASRFPSFYLQTYAMMLLLLPAMFQMLHISCDVVRCRPFGVMNLCTEHLNSNLDSSYFNTE